MSWQSVRRDTYPKKSRVARESSPGAVAFRRWYYVVFLACSVGLNVVLLVPRDEFGAALVSGIYLQSWAALHALALIVLLSLRRVAPSALLIAITLSAYVLLSVVWSVTPEQTVRSSISLVATIAVAYAMAVDLSASDVLKLVARVVTTLTIAGIVAYFLQLDIVYYIDAHARPNYLGLDPLRGFYTHKIAGSLFAVIGMVASAVAFEGWRRIAAVGVAVLFVLLAGSATGLVLAVLAMALFAVVFWARSHRITLVSVVVVSLPALAALALFGAASYSEVLELMGRDETLTGRTDLWQAGLLVWSQSPVVGWGLDAYLSSPTSSWIQLTYSRFQNYDVPHFHSSYIQTAVDLGGIGFLVLVAILARGTWVAGSRAVAGTNPAASAVLVLHLVWLAAAPFMILFLRGNYPVTLLLFVFFFQTLRPDEPILGKRAPEPWKRKAGAPRRRPGLRPRGT